MPNTGKTWFITGASSGFGRAFATYALSRGDNVVATARSLSRLEALGAQAPDRVLALALDVDRSGDARKAIDAAVARFGRIDVLVNNAGYGIVGAIEETSEAELRAVMETNFFGAVAVTRAALPVLRAQRAGAIVNISSMGGQMSAPGFGAYSASKFALEGFSEALAQELASFGVKVLIVEPGAFRTDFAGAALRHMPILEPYREIVGPIRAFASGMDATQEGDPAKAAAAVAAALSAESTPLRLQLGRDSVEAVRTHAEKLLDEMKPWESIAVNTGISAAA
jgi:NAD(P)-dependent dehydrogenase (short-subunit alcohol dehydrogenase family)